MLLRGGTDRKPVTTRVITRVMGTMKGQSGLAQPGTLQGAVLGCVCVHAYSHTGRGQGHDVQGTLESVCLCPAPFGDLHSEPLGSRSGGDLPGDGGKAGKETQLKVV